MPQLPPETNLARRKRRRKALSCFECRRRKVKCDRKYPVCNRCSEMGNTTACIYTPEARKAQDEEDMDECSSYGDAGLIHQPHKNVNIHTPPSIVSPGDYEINENVASILRMQANKIAELEERLASLEAPVRQSLGYGELNRITAFGLSSYKSIRRKSADLPVSERPETMIIRGKGSRIRFHGASSPLSVLAHFAELASFLNEAVVLNPLSRARHDLKIFKKRGKALSRLSLLVSNTNPSDLLALLPTRDVCEVLVQRYLKLLEPTYHILHVPSFLSKYTSLWTSPSATPPNFVALVLLIIAAVSCISTKSSHQTTSTYLGDSNCTRENAIRLISAVDTFLSNQSLKHTSLALYQLHILSHLAKLTCTVRAKAHYLSASTLLHLGIAAGLHRLLNHESSQKTPNPFEQEMRARLWGVMMEIELQASIDRGLPSALSNLPWNTPVPRNVKDEEFRLESGNDLVIPKHDTEFTHTSYLVWSRKSLELRIRICGIVNDHVVVSKLSYGDILELHDEITTQLSSLPNWTDAESRIPKLVLDIQLRQLLIVLHAPFCTSSSPSQAEFSRSASLNASSSIISQHAQVFDAGFASDSMDIFPASHAQNIPDVEVEGLEACDAAHNATSLLLRGGDLIRATLTLARTVLLSLPSLPLPISAASLPSPPNANASLVPPAVETIQFHSARAITPLLERSVKLWKERIVRLGRGHQDMCLVSGAYSLVMATLHPEQAKWQKRESIERVVRLFKAVSENQVVEVGGRQVAGACFGIATGSANMGRELGVDGNAAGVEALQDMAMEMELGAGVGAGDFEYEDLSAWTFDEFWPFETEDRMGF